ncbi:lysis protein [Xenorhabdus bovienii]|uniref:Putative endopeptidase (Protein gp15) n=1 Tax=Xenorhabdus bovienii TaxID=40576 RepID=A0A0B6X3M9_XENBV|nr:lysis protein [Xenorhabdus bovienii]CDM88190.1 putative endopeptidase (Protein gp15) [Xenorhabdus bovienii]
MKWQFKIGAVIVALALIGAAVHSIYSVYAENGRLTQDIETLNKSLSEQVAINATRQEHIRHLAELDAKHIRELDNAKSEIDTLRSDVAAGRRKLRIKAVCPVRETTSSRGMVDATTVELTGETGSTVLDIREDIINDRAKLRYLQDYVNTECGRKNNG